MGHLGELAELYPQGREEAGAHQLDKAVFQNFGNMRLQEGMERQKEMLIDSTLGTEWHLRVVTCWNNCLTQPSEAGIQQPSNYCCPPPESLGKN